MLGYAVICLGLLQPIIATLRPDGETDPTSRALWFSVHKYGGWISLAMAMLNMAGGMSLWNPGQVFSIVYVTGILASLGVVAAWHVAPLL